MRRGTNKVGIEAEGSSSQPVLQYHYNILAALALQQDTPSPDDTTLPDVQAIVSRAGPMLKSIKETLNNDERYANVPWRQSATATVIDRPSRSATIRADDEGEDRKPKKVKVSSEKASMSMQALEKILVKGFNGGENGMKKVCCLGGLRSPCQKLNQGSWQFSSSR